MNLKLSSLYLSIEEHPYVYSQELLDAFEDYKNGKSNAKRKMRKYVNKEISEKYYNELLEKYSFFHRMNRAKIERERKQKIKRILCCILSISVLLCSAESSLDYLLSKYSVESAVYYFFLYLWAVFYAFAYNPNLDEIAKLERENKILKEKIKNYERSDAVES